MVTFMKYFLKFSLVLLATYSLAIFQIDGHGFSGDTLIKISDQNTYQRIDALCQNLLKTKVYIASYDTNSATYVNRLVTLGSTSKTNCYVKLWFDDFLYADISCTPTQEFYVPAINQWIQACRLHVGDLLLGQSHELKQIVRIEFITEPLQIYTLEIKGTHNFFVGRHAILTHNMLLPAAASLFVSIPAGGMAGGSIGGFFGPIAFASGMIVGSIIGAVVKAVCDSQTPTYKTPTFDVDYFNNHFRNSVNLKDQQSEGAQAPGKPTEKEGYEPPKKWDGEKKRHPKNGKIGWPDSRGNIWVPSGPNGHGGPHWDVQFPKGGYENVLPGGRIRGQK